MKKTICIALSALAFCAMPFHISAEEAEQLPPESSANPSVAETGEKPDQTDAPSPDLPVAAVEPLVTDYPYDSAFSIPETVYIPVESIELAEFKTKMYVEETQNLSATVSPSSATNHDVSYSSSNTRVATVSAGGKLTAVGKGTCQIYVSCDNYSVYYPLTVNVKTESIEVVSKFIVLKPGEQLDLEAAVQPAEAPQELKFKSDDDSVVQVSEGGILTAVATGSTSVIVSNEDDTILVNVIVSTDKEAALIQNPEESDDASDSQKSDSLAKQIRETNEREIIVKNLSCISSEVLKALYGTDKSLTVDLEEYTLSIRGQDIFNANNEINTKLELADMDSGMLVTLGEENLPGTISIALKNAPKKYKYFYLVSPRDGVYQALNSLSDNTFKVSSIGQYLLSTKNMNRRKINIVWVLGGIGVIFLLSLIYIFTKKKYWFW
ncbi:MAG: Ig-like domain-containing protein [Oscillospiraceae bacterium]|nr:Ig-like domain-containing protein [Oscillospiraceae bacterium]